MRRERWRRLVPSWPWAVLALAVVPAIWHVIDFEGDIDPEFPRVARRTYNRFPPAAYRLAEPGDTIDRIALYLSAAAVVLAAGSWLMARRRRAPAGFWPAALALGLAATWYSATPGPSPSGWHGLGWRAMFDPTAPAPVRIALAGAAAVLGLVVARSGWAHLPDLMRTRGARGLLLAAAGLVLLRQVEVPGAEPVGYWPRWAFVWGLAACVLALVRLAPPGPGRWSARLGLGLAGLLGWSALVAAGIALTWYHRPIDRLKLAVPGRIYISAMPTYRGLAIAHGRHHFKTVINLFPEDTGQRSPLWAEELRFVRERHLAYLRSPADPDLSDAFLTRTLAVARDPDAWPILVHCHGCMDRTPAWLGIYRFLVEGRPLVEALKEIERHRGYRPKASVTMLYNHALPRLAPDRWAEDPTARELERNAAREPSPYGGPVARR